MNMYREQSAPGREGGKFKRINTATILFAKNENQ